MSNTNKSKAVRDPRATDQDLTPEARAGRRTETYKDQKNVLRTQGIELDPDYHYHWINDDPGEGSIEKAKRRGYEFVYGEAKVGDDGRDIGSGGGTPIRAFAGIDSLNQPMWAYFMRTRMEWYEEDQKAKREELRKFEQGREEVDDKGNSINIGRRESKHAITRNPGDR